MENIFAFTNSNDTNKDIIKFFESYNLESNIKTGGLDMAVEYCRQNPSPNLMIIDISGYENALRKIKELANYCEANTELIILDANTSLTMYKQLTNMGVSDYFELPINFNDLIAAVRKIIQNDDNRSKTNQKNIVSFIGTNGGVGTTTLLSTISAFMSKIIGTRICLIDYNFYNSDMDLLLDIEAIDNAQELFENIANVDKLYIDRTVVRVNERLKTLIGKNGNNNFNISSGDLEIFLDSMEQSSNYILMDISSRKSQSEFIKNCYDISNVVVLIMTPTISAIRETNNILNKLKDTGYQDRVLVVLNPNYQTSNKIEQKQIESLIGRKINYIVPQLKAFMDIKDLKLQSKGGGSYQTFLNTLSLDIMGIPDAKNRQRIGNKINNMVQDMRSKFNKKK